MKLSILTVIACATLMGPLVCLCGPADANGPQIHIQQHAIQQHAIQQHAVQQHAIGVHNQATHMEAWAARQRAIKNGIRHPLCCHY
jgi:hypothetical protein